MVNGAVLSGKWIEPTASGEIIFTMSDDGKDFVGRFDNGEYWNGRRIVGPTYIVPFDRTDTPREVLRTFLVTINAAQEGAITATLELHSLLHYDGEETSEYERRRRRSLFKQIIDLTTFRFLDAPNDGISGKASFEIGTLDNEWQYSLRFREKAPGKWQVVVPTPSELIEDLETGLEASGYKHFSDYHQAQKNSPRGVMHDFMMGFINWENGGDEQALSCLDLADIPDELQEVEGAIAAENLFLAIGRVGHMILQELPNSPRQTEPYIHFKHPSGSIEIAALPLKDGNVRWQFTRKTVEAAPKIFETLQKLPDATGLPPLEPVTDYFRLRLKIKSVSPALLKKSVILENWQWIGLLLLAVSSWFFAMTGGRAASIASRRLTSLAGGSFKAEFVAKRNVIWPVRILVIGLVLFFGLSRLGLSQDFTNFFGTISALLIVVGLTLLLLAVASILGAWVSLYGTDKNTRLDAIMATLLAGILKFAIIIGGVIAAADALGLPYEGAIAGLGISGLALAIGAKDTISNLIGAAILLADRPFDHGDFIEIAGTLATVEEVGLRSTKLRTEEDSLLVVPNSKLVDEIVNNLGQRRKRRIDLMIGVTYDTPRERLDAFVDGLRLTFLDQDTADQELYLGLKNFGESSIDIRLWGYFRVQTFKDYYEAQHQLIADIVSLAELLDVSFAFPTRTVHMAHKDSRLNEYVQASAGECVTNQKYADKFCSREQKE